MENTMRKTALSVGLALVLCTLLGASTAFACETDDECTSPEICSNGACVEAHQGPACYRDIECGAEETCDHHHCIQKMMVFPGEAPPPPAANTAPSLAAPKPAGSRPTPPPPMPETAQPPPDSAPPPPPSVIPPPPPPPGYAPSPDEPPPGDAPPPGYYPPYRHRRAPELPPPPVFKPHFAWGLYAGGALATVNAASSSPFYAGFAADGEIGYHFSPNVAVIGRIGTVIAPLASGTPTTQDPNGPSSGPAINIPVPSVYSLVYAGIGLKFPIWRWGFVLAVANAPQVNANINASQTGYDPLPGRVTGIELLLPYDYALTNVLKLGVNVGVGFFNGMTVETFHLELGF
jgi:hypothetical protein